MWLSVSVIKKQSCIGYSKKGTNLGIKCVRMRLAAGLRPDPLGKLERSPRPSSPNWGRVPTSKGEGREGNGKREGRGGKGKGGRGREGGKGRTPVPDCESAKVATLKVWGSANYSMPEDNRGPWSKKFENRWPINCLTSYKSNNFLSSPLPLLQCTQ